MSDSHPYLGVQVALPHFFWEGDLAIGYGSDLVL